MSRPRHRWFREAGGFSADGTTSWSSYAVCLNCFRSKKGWGRASFGCTPASHPPQSGVAPG